MQRTTDLKLDQPSLETCKQGFKYKYTFLLSTTHETVYEYCFFGVYGILITLDQ